MRNEFPGYYKLPENRFFELLKTAIFVFDTNVLLNVHRFSEETSKQILEAFESKKERLFLPYRIAEEYHENLYTVYEEINKGYNDLLSDLKKVNNRLQHSGRLPVVKKEIIEDLKRSVENVYKDIETKIINSNRLFNDDSKKETIADIFEGKIGERYSEEKIIELNKIAEKRFLNKIPPGYKDDGKKGNSKYGDFIIWMQIIDFAKDKNDIIFVTEDKKDDWFIEKKGKTIGPRPELIKEFLDSTNRNILIMNFSNYLKNVEKFNEDTILEIKDINLGSVKPESEFKYSELDRNYFPDDEDNYFGIGRSIE